MTNQEQLREAVEVIKDHLNRNQFWNRDKNRNDMLEVLLDLAQSHLDGKWIRKDELMKKMEGIEKVIESKIRTVPIAGDFDRTRAIYINEIGISNLASALRTYLKVGR